MKLPRGYISPQLFNACVGRMRAFFASKGFLEVHPQNRMSILAACEDPSTISTFNYAGQLWPLPQTGQMWLEYELLRNPTAPGYYCVSTSYRNEPNPVPGRHELIFPMFEYEMHGGVEEMQELQKDLLDHLGFDVFFNKDIDSKTIYPEGNYEDLAAMYKVDELDNDHEDDLCNRNGPVYFIKYFPNHTSPFWNMQQHSDGKRAKKIDVIVDGMETIGSAERSTDREQMAHMFHTISDGGYAGKLYDLFGKERVEAELTEFLDFDFFPRSGGGIGVTRMISGMVNNGLIDDVE